MTKKNLNQFLPGWDAQRVRDVVDYYEDQSDDEAAAEPEAALARSGETLMTVPTEIVPAVRELIARYEEQHQAR